MRDLRILSQFGRVRFICAVFTPENGGVIKNMRMLYLTFDSILQP